MPSSTADLAEESKRSNGPNPVAVADAFAQFLDHAGSSGVFSLDERQEAFQNFQRTRAPGGRPGRDWKFDYARIAEQLPRTHDALHTGQYRPPIQRDGLAAHLSLGPDSAQLRPTDPRANENGLRFEYANNDEQAKDRFRKHLGRAVAWRDDPFASLALAFAQNEITVHVPAGLRPERPILISHSAHGGSNFPYVRVILESGAQAIVIEDATDAGFTSGIVEIILGERAQLDYVALQRTATKATILMNRGAACAADSICRFHIAELGGALSRSVVSTRLEGRGASSEINALFYNDMDQHVDLSSLVEHNVGPSTSRTTVKSAARERGQGRYLGNIRIAKHANGSDAALRDDALLLSQRAHIDSVPALEIASNDVKAFHGATVGSIDENELFYAQSRGIPRSEAERMIALGFFEPVIAAMPLSPIRDIIRAALEAKSGGSAGAGEVA